MRRRILLAIGGTLLVMLVIITVISRMILIDSYDRLEHTYIERDIMRVQSDIDSQLDALATTTADYGAWTELYQYVKHPSRAFTDDNFSDDGTKYLPANVLLVFDSRGKLLYSRLLRADTKAGDMADALTQWIAAHPRFIDMSTPGSRSQGVIVVRGTILLSAARPIVDTGGTLGPDGTLVLARLMDGAATAVLGARLALALDLVPMGGALPAAAAGLSDADPVVADTTHPGIVTAYSILRDAEGVPAVLVSVQEPRDIRMQGVRTLRYFFFWLFFICIGFAAVVLVTVARTILSRLAHLSTSVLTIGTGGNPAQRITIGGKDQIAYLGAAINGMLDALERSTEELRASERRNEAFLDAVPDVIFRVTRDGTITDARSPSKLPLLETANDLVGRDAEQILSLYSFLSPEHFTRSITATEAALDTGVPQMLDFHVDVEGGRRYYEERFVASGKDEVIVLVREVTALKQAEEARRQEVLLKEIHHRVKNNLQVISSLLALQARAAGDERTRALLTESRDRLRSMALIHEKLYQTGAERGLSFASYVRDLAAHLRHSYAGNSETVQVRIDVEDIALDLDLSVPCGLVITELLSNALKHAFPGSRRGTVTVALHREPAGMLILSVSDDGVGLPEGVDVRSAATLGLRIVSMLVDQLKGTLTQGGGPGASFSVRFPG
jgi:two-component sensor histidine kinase/sensor domain CHASE-containing protein